MKGILCICACLFVAVESKLAVDDNQVEGKTSSFARKQKFLFEIVYRVQDPLLFSQYSRFGNKLLTDETLYIIHTNEMKEFHENLLKGDLLPRGVFFSSYSDMHMEQARGLFQYFLYAKNWNTFQRNVCWARTHISEGMFIHALTLAIIHRDDCHSLILPTIYEIFPQHFFHSGFLYAAEKFNFNVWKKQNKFRKEFMETSLWQSNQVESKNWKTWQWWKLIGLDKDFYFENKCPLREDVQKRLNDPAYVEMLKDVKMFWMPVDYTRDIEIFNDLTKLSYLMEDLDWNAYWYNVNMENSVLDNKKKVNSSEPSAGELWIYNIQQILARFYMECLSHGLGAFERVSYEKPYATGYNPQVITYSGIGFNYRKNNWDIGSYGNSDLLRRIQILENRLADFADSGSYQSYNGTKINLKHSSSFRIIADVLQGNGNNLDKKFFGSWLKLTHLYMSTIADVTSMELMPHCFLNYETTLRDPLAYSVYRKVSDIYSRFKSRFDPYTSKELSFSEARIDDVSVGRLETFFDLFDFDVSNLLSDKMTFADGQFVWDKMLMARQIRLNHKPFSVNITVMSNKPQNIVVRYFLGPKFDEFGRIIPFAQNRENFMELDQFLFQLIPGKNIIRRNSGEMYSTAKDRTTYTELYHFVSTASTSSMVEAPQCAFPNRLILPRGWSNGMPMQMFFILSSYEGDTSEYKQRYTCGSGFGVRHFDNRPLGYPFDRPIKETTFLASNMLLTEVKIYHEDNLRYVL